jgi:hypothetical protein
MKMLRITAVVVFISGAGVFGWRMIHPSFRRLVTFFSLQHSISQPANSLPSQAPSATTRANGSANHLGPFTIAGQDYTVELHTRKVQPGSTNEQGDTVVAMEIRDAAGAVQYRRTFPYQGKNEEFSDSWLVDARSLAGTNGTGLLVTYNSYSEPSAPEQEHTGWIQIFGVLNGKLVPFGGPLEVQGGLIDKYADGHTYKIAGPLGSQADVVDFKAWTGHCRLIYPVSIDWTQGKLMPAQKCRKTTEGLGIGCQYNVVPEEKLYIEGTTFVRLWPKPDETSGAPAKTVLREDSKVDLLTALVLTQWNDLGKPASPGNSNGTLDDARGFRVAPDSDLWLKVRIGDKEGWMHSEEDFRALGLPEDE